MINYAEFNLKPQGNGVMLFHFVMKYYTSVHIQSKFYSELSKQTIKIAWVYINSSIVVKKKQIVLVQKRPNACKVLFKMSCKQLKSPSENEKYTVVIHLNMKKLLSVEKNVKPS